MRIANKRADRAKFHRTASTRKALNVPGKVMARGGKRL